MLTDSREALRCRLAALPGATEEYPFKLVVRVFKVGGNLPRTARPILPEESDAPDHRA